MLFTAGGVLFAEGGFGAITRAATVAAQSRERASRAPAAKPRVRYVRELTRRTLSELHSAGNFPPPTRQNIFRR